MTGSDALADLRRRSGESLWAQTSAAAAAKDTDEDSCPAFGFLRGLHERALALELRFRDGNRETYPYSWLGPWKYNPSVGLLLKFTGDVVSLVLVRGSNLDALVNQSVIA